MNKAFLLSFLCCTVAVASAAPPPPTVPAITGFSPVSGGPGSFIQISGINFTAIASNNIVYFGAVRATVVSATPSLLEVNVPFGATYAPITVMVNGLVAYSGTSFQPTFAGGGANLDSSSLAPRFDLAGGDGAHRSAIADLDGDGIPDVAVADVYGHTISLFRNIGAPGSLGPGSFAPRVELPAEGGASDNPYGFTTADVDGDGKLDLVACDRLGDHISVYRNIASPGNLSSNSFAARVNFAVGADPRYARVADLDGDGRPDLVSCNYAANTISILRNVGAAGSLDADSFAPKVDLPAGAGVYDVVIADLDGDGKLDLAAVNQDGFSISILRNISSPGVITSNSFEPRVDLPAPNGNDTIVAGDIDGDGKPDLVIGSYLSRSMSVYRNLSTPGSLTAGSFAPRVDFSTGNWTHTVALGDLNGDGKPDIAVVGELDSYLSLFQNLSTPGSFTNASLGGRVDFGAGWNAWGVSVGDLDADGRPDIVFCNAYDDTVSIYRNLIAVTNTPPGCTNAPPGLVSWWKAENNALDSVDGNNGTIQGPVSFVAGEVGQAFDFNGYYSGVQLGNPANLQLQTFTIEAWVKRHSATQATLDPSHPDNGSFLHYDIGGYAFAPANDGRLLLSKVGVGAVYSSALRLTDTNGFHHVAVTTTGGNVVFYLDGVAESVGPYDPGYTFSGPVAIGGRGGDLAASFYGAIDELSIYNRALTTAEIQALYNAGSAGKCPPPPQPPAVPVITSFNPASSVPGSIIQILGTNFSPIASNNIVYCGAVRATVLASSPSLLQVMVPLSATYAPLTVAVNGLVAASGTPFQPEFSGGSNVTAASFAPRVDLAAPSGPIFTAIADLDGDGKPDLIVNNAYAHSLSLYRNLSITGSLDTNSFAAPVDFYVGGDPDNPYGLTVADVDGDGKLDVVICNRILSLVTVYRNIATPGSLTTASLAPPVSFQVGTDPRHVAVADLNGDGKPDMVSANYGASTISLLQNVGSAGTLTSNSFMAAVDLPAGSLTYEVGIADLDGDGKPDLAVTSDSFVLLFRNTGAGGNLGVGSFQSPAQLPSPDGTGIGIAVGDLDGDGKPDLVTCTYLSQTMSVFRNQATPGSLTAASFAPEVDFAPGCRGHTVALSDLNGDGKADIGFVGEIPDKFSVYQNVSTPGSFTTVSLAPPVDFATGYNAWGISIGDLDGDGRPDVVFCNSYATSISIYRNVIPGSNIPSCTPPPSGLVSWWRAEGNTLDNVDGNNGTLVGGAGFGTGMVGQGFLFNGSGNAVSLGSAPNLQLQNFSIEAWIRRSDPTLVTPLPGQDSVFFSFGSGGYGFGINSLGQPFLTRIDISEVHSTTVIDDLTFHHVAITKGGTNVVFYVDGVAYPAPPYTDVFSFTTPAALGARGDTFGNSFLGTVDELSIYSNVLSPAEIAALYTAGSAGKCNPLVPPFIISQPTNRTIYVGQSTTFTVSAGGTPPLQYQWLHGGVPLGGKTNATLTISNAQLTDGGNYSVIVSNLVDSVTSSNALLTVNPLPLCTPPPSGLISWWRFENNVLDNWDSNNGTTPVSSFVDAKVGRGFNFAQRFVSVPDSPSLRPTNGLTIEAWINPNGGILTMTPPHTIFAKAEFTLTGPAQQLTNVWYFLCTTNNGRILFRVSPSGTGIGSATLSTSQAVPTNQWTFVVATYDGSALRIYLNGDQAAQLAYSGGIFPGTSAVGIGGISSSPYLGGVSWPFFGIMDEVSIYNRALSPDEIQAIYQSDFIGKCLVAPTITTQPLSQLIPLNEDVKFSVSVLGSRPLKYQWRFDGQNIFRATNATLILEKLKTNNIGFYTVLVSNSVGSVISSDAALKLSPPLSCTPPPAGIISWWPADNSAGDAVDGNGLTAYTLFLNPFSPTGKVSQAFNFDGSTSRLFANNSPSLNFGSNVNFSIEGWIKALPPDVTLNPKAYPYPNTPFIEKRSGDLVGVGYSLSLYQGRLACWLATNSPNFISNSAMFISSGPDLRDGMFHHVAVTLDRSSTNGGKLFVDGNVVLTFNAFSRRGDLTTINQMFIGGPSPNTTFSNSFFYGLIDEMAIYNRALSTNEIQAIAGAGSAGKCKVPPTIVTQPVSQTVHLGSNATFTVVATGSPTLRYQWFRTVGLITVPSTNSTLFFSNVTSSVVGTYFVRVTNFFGSVTSSNAVLALAPIAPPASGVIQFSMTGGQPLLKFTGIAGQPYLVQASTNLVDWTLIGTATDLGDGNFEFADPDWTNYNSCFYRIILP